MKTIYLIRHGESTVNADKEIYRGADAPLTEHGIKQAQYLARRASKLRFDALLASPMARTAQTAELIAKETGHVTEYQDLFLEWHMPTSLNGRRQSDIDVDALAHRAIAARNGGGERVEDSENFEDLSSRAARALDFLETYAADRILVVGHGFFSRIMIARMLYGEKLTPEVFEPLIWGMRTQNTGITVLHFDRADAHRRSWLSVFNDHGHLG